MKKNLSKKTSKLGIITVVKSDHLGLEATGHSIFTKIKQNNFEWIVWINSSSLKLEEHILIAKKYKAHKIFVEDDLGIFDSMNKSLERSDSELILFLNARDTVIEEIYTCDLHGPTLIPVQYTDYFGRRRRVKVNQTLKLGIPYCHQGMILPRKGYHYDTGYKFGADYLALLRLNLEWPLPLSSKGLINYDTTGISTVNRWESDRWTAKIILKEFGFLSAIYFISYCGIKLVVKRFFDFWIFCSRR